MTLIAITSPVATGGSVASKRKASQSPERAAQGEEGDADAEDVAGGGEPCPGHLLNEEECTGQVLPDLDGLCSPCHDLLRKQVKKGVALMKTTLQLVVVATDCSWLGDYSSRWGEAVSVRACTCTCGRGCISSRHRQSAHASRSRRQTCRDPYPNADPIGQMNADQLFQPDDVLAVFGVGDIGAPLSGRPRTMAIRRLFLDVQVIRGCSVAFVVFSFPGKKGSELRGKPDPGRLQQQGAVPCSDVPCSMFRCSNVPLSV